MLSALPYGGPGKIKIIIGMLFLVYITKLNKLYILKNLRKYKVRNNLVL